MPRALRGLAAGGRFPPAEDELTKVCSRCKQAKPTGEFYGDRTAKDGLASRCSTCSREYRKEWGRKNPDRVRQLHRDAKKRRRAFLDDLKKGPCVDCGGVFPPYVYDFDHVEGEKLFRIADWVPNGGPTPAQIIEEVAKCEIRCSNCHRIRHWEQYRPTGEAA